MFLFGEPPHALNTRNIQATELKGGIFDYLISADELRTGYGGNLALEQSKSGFGFGTPYGDQGGIYGEQVSGVLRLLCLSGNWSGPVFADFLYDWGQRFELLLVDWWQNRVLLLNDRELILKVIDGDDDE